MRMKINKEWKAIAVMVAALAIIFTLFSIYHGEDTRGMTIEQYIRENISTLSPKKEVLGGKFYVISLRVADGSGTVVYEDGHIGLRANFTYEIDKRERPRVTSFVIVE